MNSTRHKHLSRTRRHNRVRAKVAGHAERPRLTVFRSLKHISAQLIDDRTGKTLLSVTDAQLPKSKDKKTDMATAVGKLLATKAKEKKIAAVVFDRGSYQYHGRVKALAEAARAEGLTF